jgi:hypothetical protein
MIYIVQNELAEKRINIIDLELFYVYVYDCLTIIENQ